MATLSVRNPTLLDLAKIRDPDGKIATVVEILNETNEILDDMSWMEGNLPTGHRTSMRSGIPAPTWRKMYGGVQPNKSTSVTVTDNTGMLEAFSEVDKALADLNGNTSAFRLQEDRAHIEGMNQEVADTLFYGNEATEPEAFTGLAPRFNDLSAENADNIINEGDSSNLQSIWMVVWGPNTIHGIIPKGSTAGLQVKDMGETVIEDASDGSNTGRMVAYRTHYRWDVGLSLRDWRYVVRIANIDTTAIVKDAATGPDLPDLMFRAMDLVPNLSAGRPAFYMSRGMRTGLRRQVPYATASSTLEMENVGGKMLTTFQGVPVKRVDALATSETAVA